MSGALSKTASGGLSKYDPDKGLKTIAVAEAAVKHFARAKDATNLQKAIRAKLEAQAEFVFWWDTQAKKAPEGRPKKNSVRSDGVSRLGSDGLPDEQIVRRWRNKLNDPVKFEATYEAALARYLKILELEQTAHVSQNSGENEWYTPTDYIEAARAVLGTIDLDPASTDVANGIVKAEQIYTLADDALAQRWDGRVWMNPPYSQPLITQFCDKLAASVRDGTVPAAIVLVNNATETQWFRALADVSSAICFPSGRVRFWSPGKTSATPLQGQAVLYAGAETSTFCDAFQRFGFLVEIRRDAAPQRPEPSE